MLPFIENYYLNTKHEDSEDIKCVFSTTERIRRSFLSRVDLLGSTLPNTILTLMKFIISLKFPPLHQLLVRYLPPYYSNAVQFE